MNAVIIAEKTQGKVDPKSKNSGKSNALDIKKINTQKDPDQS